MKLSLYFFSPRDGIYGVGVEVDGASGGPRNKGARPIGGRPLSRGHGVGSRVYFFRPEILINSKSTSVDFQDIPRTFLFYT